MVDDAVAIRTAGLRAEQLPEPHRKEVRALLKEYLDVRLSAALGREALPRALVRTAALQDELWSRAVAFGQETPAIPMAAAFAQALIQMFEVNLRRVAAALHGGIPTTIWIALYCVTALRWLRLQDIAPAFPDKRSMGVTLQIVSAGVCCSVPPHCRSLTGPACRILDR